MIGELITSPEEWDERMMRLALEACSWSKDPHRRVGAAVVSADRRRFSLGYNGFPRGTVDLKQRLMEPDDREHLMTHAEVNAIVNTPFDTVGCALYSTRFPCAPCAGYVANAGIVRVVSPAPEVDGSRWGTSQTYAIGILSEAGIEVMTMKLERRDAEPVQ